MTYIPTGVAQNVGLAVSDDRRLSIEGNGVRLLGEERMGK